jgi:hypothetical protein
MEAEKIIGKILNNNLEYRRGFYRNYIKILYDCRRQADA